MSRLDYIHSRQKQYVYTRKSFSTRMIPVSVSWRSVQLFVNISNIFSFDITWPVEHAFDTEPPMYMYLCIGRWGGEVHGHITKTATRPVYGTTPCHCLHAKWPTPGTIAGVDNVCGCRYVSDCRSRGREFDPVPVSYFSGDKSWNNFYGHSPPFHWLKKGCCQLQAKVCTRSTG